jgi:hypothetical protein
VIFDPNEYRPDDTDWMEDRDPPDDDQLREQESMDERDPGPDPPEVVDEDEPRLWTVPSPVAELDPGDIMRLFCPYYMRGLPGADPKGVCISGCYDEPACQTSRPREGWSPWDAAVAADDELLHRGKELLRAAMRLWEARNLDRGDFGDAVTRWYADVQERSRR